MLYSTFMFFIIKSGRRFQNDKAFEGGLRTLQVIYKINRHNHTGTIVATCTDDACAVFEALTWRRA